jgi:aldehyde:ferredoxin oxidoreductase
MEVVLLGGYMGKIVWIDLSTEKYHIETITNEILRKFLGGTGLAAYLLSKCNFELIRPLGPENVIIFATGPLTGTNVPTSGRYAVAAKSPLTGIWGESDSGGRFGIGLKQAGFDAVAITGKAQYPLVILIKEDKVLFVPAENLWGKDTYETFDILQEKYGNKAGIVCIGPAGEKLIPLASIMSEGKHGRAAGRCGLGAVMGSKYVKAIVAFGKQQIPVANSEELRTSIREITKVLISKMKRMHDFGTPGGVVGNAALGDCSAYNWRDGNCAEKAEAISGERIVKEYVVSNYNCPTCVVGCGKTVRITRGPYRGTVSGCPEYETIAGFGAQCGTWDLALVIEANDLCNRLGVDTISVSSVIAFLLEAAEKNFIKSSVSDPKLQWGNPDTVINLINMIISGEGLGTIIRNGVCEAVKKLGSETEKFALHVKGLEFPYHDPRALAHLAVAYATSPRGACHRGCTHNITKYPLPGLGLAKVDRFDKTNKGRETAIVQNFAELFNCLKLCQFCMATYDLPVHLKWVNFVTGWEMTSEELLRVGERSFNLKRLLNISCGLTGEDDKLPYRTTHEAFTEGTSAGYIPDFSFMLKEYYQSRGWSEDGIPTIEKLEELDLS